MIKIIVNQRYKEPIREGFVRGIIQSSLEENIEIGEVITLVFAGLNKDSIRVKVKDIERLRIDELTNKHIANCGYIHLDILEDHIVEDLSIDRADGVLIYYISFELANDETEVIETNYGYYLKNVEKDNPFSKFIYNDTTILK